MYRAANIPEGLARPTYREVRRVCLTLLEAIPSEPRSVAATTTLLVLGSIEDIGESRIGRIL